MKNVEKLTFKRFIMTIGNLPSSYVDSLSYYECLVWLCKYLHDTVIPALNNNGEAVKELQQKYIELKNYVDTYFDNLDVQEEINNKLDDMVEQGTIQDIISAYLNSRAIFGYDTVADMKESINLTIGSYARTLGYYNKDDKGGNLYYITDTDTEDIRSIELDSGLYAIAVIDSQIIVANKFGAYCDKTHDDKVIIQNLIDYCKEYNYILKLDGYAYVSDTIDTKAVKIIGEGIPSDASNTYTSSEYGYIGFDYLRNTGDGALITFDDYKNDVLKTGSGIISDVANPILKCSNKDGKFNLENLSICGWLRNNINQEGLLSTYESDDDTYINGKHIFNNVHVFNCSGNGIHLQSLEVTVVNRLYSGFNFGYGLYIEGVSGFDTPFEYVDLNDCHFNGNKLGGVYAHNCFRKQVRFNRCQSNSSGLYNELGLTIPSNTDELVAGFKIDGRESSSTAARKCLVFDNCYGEETNKLIEIISNTSESSYILNNITIKNCVCYPHGTASQYDCLLNLKTYYTDYFSYHDNYYNGTGGLIITNTNHLTPLVVTKEFYDSYSMVKTINLNSKLTSNNVGMTRYGNMIHLNVIATANADIAAYENLFSNFPTPSGNAFGYILIGDNVKAIGLYSNNQATTGAAITNGQKVNIFIDYFVSPTYDK